MERVRADGLPSRWAWPAANGSEERRFGIETRGTARPSPRAPAVLLEQLEARRHERAARTTLRDQAPQLGRSRCGGCEKWARLAWSRGGPGLLSRKQPVTCENAEEGPPI
jgi:hypothetical protein